MIITTLPTNNLTSKMTATGKGIISHVLNGCSAKNM